MKRDIYTGLPIILVGDRMIHKILYRCNIDIFAILFLLFVDLSNHLYQTDDTKMELRTIAILVLMATIVVLTSAFGAYQDGIEKQKEHEFDMKKKAEKANKTADNPSTLVGASGAGTSYKQSAAHLDVSEKVDMPYVKEGPNAYRGKAGGYDLRDTYDSDDDSDGNDRDSDDDDGKPATEFQRKVKYIKTIFKEIFSKWSSQEPIMAPVSVEEDPDNPLGEGFKIREKFKKGARQGMRKLKNAFRGRFK